MQATLFQSPPTSFQMPDIIPAPKYPPVTEVINKILNVKKKNTARISPADVAEMETLQKWFDEKNGQLDRWEMLFKFELQHQYPDEFTIEGTGDDIDVSINHNAKETDNPFWDKEFDPCSSLEKVFNKRYQLQEQFISVIIRYFETTYTVNIPSEPENPETIYTYAPVIDFIFSVTNVSDLKENAKQALIKSFYGLIYGKHGATLEKNKVVFESLNFWRLERNEEKFSALFLSLGYFETGEVGNLFIGKEIVLGAYKQSKNYELGGAKIKSVRLYQNGKAILYFTNEVTANEFFNMF